MPDQRNTSNGTVARAELSGLQREFDHLLAELRAVQARLRVLELLVQSLSVRVALWATAAVVISSCLVQFALRKWF